MLMASYTICSRRNTYIYVRGGEAAAIARGRHNKIYIFIPKFFSPSLTLCAPQPIEHEGRRGKKEKEEWEEEFQESYKQMFLL